MQAYLRALWQRIRANFIPIFLTAGGTTAAILHVFDLQQAIPTALAVIAILLLVPVLSQSEGLNHLLTLSAMLLPALLLLFNYQLFFTFMYCIKLELADGLPAFFLYAAPFASFLGWWLYLICSFFHSDVKNGSVSTFIFACVISLILILTRREDALPYLLPALVAGVAELAIRGRSNEAPLSAYAIPGVLALALILLIPAQGLTIPPLAEKTAEIRQQIHDMFFYTDTREVFSLSSLGYYPGGRGQLGGSVVLTDDFPVLQVVTPRDVYLRGSIYNEYTGRTWLDTTGGRRYLWRDPRWRSERSRAFDMDLPDGALGSASVMTEQTVRVRMLAEGASTLFVPQRTRSLSVGGSIIPYFKTGSEIFATRKLEPGDTWSVEAALCTADDAGIQTLIDACAKNVDAQYAQVLRTYTALPAHLQSVVYDLAREAAGDAATPFERAMNIRNYLRRNYRYTLKVKDGNPNLDFVTNFLFNTREGYCIYFATAMTVLCRMVGLPARYVEGFHAVPDANGNAVLTAADGHAWTEIYFGGFGWLTFDATGSSNQIAPPQTPPDYPDPPEPPEDDPDTEPPPEAPDEPEEPEAPEDPEEPEDPEDPDEPEQPQKEPPVLWPWLLLLLLLAGTAVVLRILQTQPARMAARAADVPAAYGIWVQAVNDALNALGLPRRPGESPQAWLSHTGIEALSALGQSLSRVSYGGRASEAADVELAAACWTQLLPQLTLSQKLRLYLRRAFTPLKKRDFRS